MGLISFMKDKGVKIFGKSEEKLEKEKADLITAHIKKFGFDTSSIQVVVDGRGSDPYRQGGYP